MLQVYLSIIVLIVAGLAAYWILYGQSIEGFDVAGQLFERGADARQGLPQVFVTAPVSSVAMRSAMGMPSSLPGLIGTSSTVNPDTALINTTDGQNALAQQTAQCRSIRSPSAIIRTPDQTVSCGWLFPPGLASGFAAIGTTNGPLLSQHQQLVQNSRYMWQWDPVQAQIEEDKRECARITSCTGIAGTGCGWCTANNRAVPINTDGSLKYAAAAPCAVSPTTNIASCPVPTIATQQITGPGASASRSATQPAADGTCGPACIRDAVLTRGCDVGGALAVALASGTNLSSLPQVQDLASRNFMLGSKILTGAAATQTEALQEATQLVQGRTNADGVVARATTSLCTGGIPYDVCSASEDGTVVPRTECLKQIWQQAGCGPRGANSPESVPATWRQYMTAADARQAVTSIVRRMASTDVAIQQDAIRACLGASLVRPPAPKCTEPGVEVVYYDYTGGDLTLLRRREIVSEGFPSFDAGGGNVLRSGKRDRVQLKVIGRIQPPPGQGGIQDIRVRSDDGIIVSINGIRVINGWRDQGPTIYERQAILNADSNTSSLLEVDWYENYGGAVMQLWIADSGRGNYRDIPSNWLYLTQTRMTAFLVWPFYRNVITEARGLSQTSSQGNISFVGGGPEVALQLNGTNAIYFDQMLPLDQITAIAMNIYMEPTQPSAINENGLVLLELGTAATGRLTFHYVGGEWKVMYVGGGGTAAVSIPGAVLGQWVRLIFVVADDSRSATLHVAGKSATASGPWAASSTPTTGIMGATSLTPSRANYRVSVMAIYDYGIAPEMLIAGARE